MADVVILVDGIVATGMTIMINVVTVADVTAPIGVIVVILIIHKDRFNSTVTNAVKCTFTFLAVSITSATTSSPLTFVMYFNVTSEEIKSSVQLQFILIKSGSIQCSKLRKEFSLI